MVHLTPEAAARHDEAERQPLPPQEAKEWMTNKEREDGQMLAEIMGTDFERALRILRRHDGDMEKAANAFFSGAAEDPEREENLANIRKDFAHMFPDQSQSKSREVDAPSRGNVVIDLTGDDDDLSMGTTTTRFRATTRSPDPAWQMVPANRPVIKSEEDQLNERWCSAKVVARSPCAQMWRQRLTRLWSYNVFSISPQVRQRCSKLRLHLINGQQPRQNPDWAIWTLVEMFTALDLGKISVYLDEDLLNAWEAPPLKQSDSVGTLSKLFLESVVELVQHDLDDQQLEASPLVHRLFQFTHCKLHIPATGSPDRVFEPDFGHVVSIEINPEAPGPANELVARLSQTLNTYNDDGSSYHQLITHPSEVVTFEIIVNTNTSAKTGGEPEPFAYPKTIYMDQFLEANVDLANETRAAERDLRREVEGLVKRKRDITRYEDQDTFENLRGAIDYYENIASCDSPSRLATLRSMATKLKNTLRKLEGEVREIDVKITTLQGELDGLWDNPELKCHPYDLRAVLVHTGLPGRKHIYSYVQEKGTWWKTVDYTVTEVSEDLVLSDPAGLHLGAGPYMLMYSRRQSETDMNQPIEWPRCFVDLMAQNNATFLKDLPLRTNAGAGPAGGREEDAMDLS
ncbi:Glycoside hydrolase family 79 protein [Mycena venus]|uniref:Glycoside hydrolase family 79 protein n=1 Tax=Mycena venus TaxID=2733690 RepID=A0A8H6YDQ6_9AGAR|nr:Glycoside hydrolase family 79 protein [Mycena venus]